MIRSLFHAVAAVTVVAGMQTAALGAMILDKAMVLSTGREIVLDVEPIDPRDLFRGDYVRLGYGAISRVEAQVRRELPRDAETIFVTLRRAGGSADWGAVRYSLDHPGEVAQDEIVLRGSLPYRRGPGVQYGIESYFVPEGEGRRLERLIGKRAVKVVVAVAADGRAGIKGLMVDGKRVYEEPPF